MRPCSKLGLSYCLSEVAAINEVFQHERPSLVK